MYSKKISSHILSFFLQPQLYIISGAATGIVMPLFHQYNLRIPVFIILLAIPAWYLKSWLKTNNRKQDDYRLEEDFVP